MVSLLTYVFISQTPATLPAEPMWQRLEARVSLKTAPVSLPEALNEIGRRSGVRVVCDQSLQKAVVVVRTHEKPAKEVLERLAIGIGARLEIEKGQFALRQLSLDEYDALKNFKVPVEERFSLKEAEAVTVELGEIAYRFLQLHRVGTYEESIDYDPTIAIRVADPFRYDPHTLTESSPVAEVAEKLGLNAVVYLSDHELFYLQHQRNPIEKQLTGRSVLDSAYFLGCTFRKRGDWFLGYPADLRRYWEYQFDRAAWGNFMKQAASSGALSFDQNLMAVRKLQVSYFMLAQLFARHVRPGFLSLNPVRIEALDFVGSLDSGLLTRAWSGKVPVASLSPKLKAKFQAMVSANGLSAPSLEDSVDAPPTLEDYLRSRFSLARSTAIGVIALNGIDQLRSNSRYDFVDFEDLKESGSIKEAMARFDGKACWAGRKDNIRVHLEIPRRHPRSFQTTQLVTDVSKKPLTRAELERTISQYFGG